MRIEFNSHMRSALQQIIDEIGYEGRVCKKRPGNLDFKPEEMMTEAEFHTLTPEFRRLLSVFERKTKFLNGEERLALLEEWDADKWDSLVVNGTPYKSAQDAMSHSVGRYKGPLRGPYDFLRS